MKKNPINLKISEDDPDVAYLRLPDHPGAGTPNIVSKQITLGELVKGYKGPAVYLDFDNDGKLIGIEILA
jgi:uncharacterized protein YuzE